MDKKAGTENEERGTRKNPRNPLSSLFIAAVTFFLLPFTFCPSTFSADKWPGVDESVVEKFAREHGRESREPLINTDQGDLLLFVFLLAGTVGGFAAGYYWRMIVEGKGKKV
jgi:cobalt/nickel transport protein